MKNHDNLQNASTYLEKLIVVLLHLHVTDGTWWLWERMRTTQHEYYVLYKMGKKQTETNANSGYKVLYFRRANDWIEWQRVTKGGALTYTVETRPTWCWCLQTGFLRMDQQHAYHTLNCCFKFIKLQTRLCFSRISWKQTHSGESTFLSHLKVEDFTD